MTNKRWGTAQKSALWLLWPAPTTPAPYDDQHQVAALPPTLPPLLYTAGVWLDHCGKCWAAPVRALPTVTLTWPSQNKCLCTRMYTVRTMYAMEKVGLTNFRGKGGDEWTTHFISTSQASGQECCLHLNPGSMLTVWPQVRHLMSLNFSQMGVITTLSAWLLW
jgi:hypothetical protein